MARVLLWGRRNGHMLVSQKHTHGEALVVNCKSGGAGVCPSEGYSKECKVQILSTRADTFRLVVAAGPTAEAPKHGGWPPTVKKERYSIFLV